MEEESLSSERPKKSKKGKTQQQSRPKANTGASTANNKSKNQGQSKSKGKADADQDEEGEDMKIELGKNIDLQKLDPLYFVGERDANIKANHYSDDGGFNYDSFENTTPDFARPDRRKDASGRGIFDPDYDPTTLYVPKDWWDKFTPAIAQYWKIKEKNCEKIIFFKLGKFYEFLYEDAIVAVKELGIRFMGSKLHAGFPEAALEKYASILVEKGYTVGIVEQIETPE